jgi:hypothetical protein
MSELQQGIEDYLASPESAGTEEAKLDKYSADAQKIIHESPEWQYAQDAAFLMDEIESYQPEKLYSDEEAKAHYDKMGPEKKEVEHDQNFLRVALAKSIFVCASHLVSDRQLRPQEKWHESESIAAIKLFRDLLEGKDLLSSMKDPHMWGMYLHHSGTDPIIMKQGKKAIERGWPSPFVETIGDDYSLENIVRAEYQKSVLDGSYNEETHQVEYNPVSDEEMAIYKPALEISLKIAEQMEKELSQK